MLEAEGIGRADSKQGSLDLGADFRVLGGEQREMTKGWVGLMGPGFIQ